MDVLLFESLGIGAVLGLLLGLTGAGGSLVALPLLLSLHLPLRDAIGVSLGAVALSALIGAIPRARQGQVAWRPVLVLALAGLPSNAVGQWLGRFVPEGVLIVAFCLLVLWSAWRMWRGAGMKREASDQARSLPLLGIGLAVGLLSGLMGVGGGFLVVPGLLWFTPLSMMAATATSMAVIALVSGGGFLIYLTGAHPPLPLLGGLAAGGAVGVLGGNLLAQRLGGPTLQRLFALMLVAVSFSLAAQKLYGGVDSSLLVGLLHEAGVDNLLTFSIGFEDAGGERGDEFQYSDLIAERYHTRHHRLRIGEHEVIEQLPAAFRAMSEPMVSHDCIAFYLLAREVSKHCKVVQSGQGADELFAGYHWYPKVDGADDAFAAYRAAFFDRDHEEYLATVGERFRVEDVAGRFVRDHFASPGAEAAVDKALRLDSTIMLVDDPVKRVDNMTMAWGLEARVPFLDYRLAELSARIPARFKLGDGGKQVLKGAARKVIPSEVIDRPKGYFPVPGLKHLQGRTREWVRELLLDPSQDRGLFQPAIFDRLLSDPDGDLTPLRGSKLWQLAALNLWLSEQGL